MLSPTAAALFRHEMKVETERLHRDDPNYIRKLQAILQKETLFLRHQSGLRALKDTLGLPRPVGVEDYGGNSSIPTEPTASLTHNDRSSVRRALAVWHLPQEFRSIVHQVHRRCRSREIFNHSQLRFLLDAWVVAEFACLHEGTDRVRLLDINEQWPDGYASVRGMLHNVEVTTALSLGRKMGDEYKVEGSTQLDSVENWIAGADELPDALEKAIKKKIEKRYGSPTVLVVYLNISEYGIRQAQSKYAISEIKQRYLSSFAGLHILWKDKLY